MTETDTYKPGIKISRGRQQLIWLIVSTAFFMENLDGTVIATALPQIARTFGVDPVFLSIGMTSYLVALTVFIPVSGWVADRYGTRTVFTWAMVAFTATSVLCALSTSVPAFTASRILQGIAGAMMVPVGRLAVVRSVGKEDLVRAMAFIVWPSLVAPVVGPPLGGFIATYLTWQWIFILNVPLGIAGVVLIQIFLPNTPPLGKQPLDVLGFLLSLAMLSAFMIGVEALSHDNGLALGLGLLAASVVLTFVLTAHLRRHPHPLMDFGVFATKSFRIVMLGGTFARTALGAMPFLLPLLFQIGFGLNAFQSGMLFLSTMLGNLAIKLVAIQSLRRFGFRGVLIGNGIISIVTILLCATLTPSTPVLIIVAVMLAHGCSRSLQFSALTSMAFCDVPKHQVATANTLFSTTQQMSLGLGIAVGALVLHTTANLRGAPGHYDLTDFRVAFLVGAGLTLFAVLDFLRLARGTGDEVSGHRQPRRSAAQ